MVQVKVYGYRTALNQRRRDQLSDAIHKAAHDCLDVPWEKRFHRFVPLEAADFIHPADRSGAYTIIEVHLMAGRTLEQRQGFLRTLSHALTHGVGLRAIDVEIVLLEAPPENWIFRGITGDELMREGYGREAPETESNSD